MVYETLRQTREKRQITQEKMATYLGYRSYNAYAMKERGERKFSVEEALHVAKVLGKTVEEIFLP